MSRSAWNDSLSSLRAAGQTVAVAGVAATPWLVLVMPLAWLAGRQWKNGRRRGRVSAAEESPKP